MKRITIEISDIDYRELKQRQKIYQFFKKNRNDLPTHIYSPLHDNERITISKIASYELSSTIGSYSNIYDDYFNGLLHLGLITEDEYHSGKLPHKYSL